MKFKTGVIQQNYKTIVNLTADFIYLDVADKKLYMASDNQALSLNIDFEDVKDEKVFVISKNDFLHVIQFVDGEIELKPDYSFVAGDIKGKFEKNENYLEVLDSIKIMFKQSDEYTPLFEVNEDVLAFLNRGNIFVKADDDKVPFQHLNLKSGYIFSSSMFRIYINKFPIEIDGIIHANVLKALFQLGLNTKVLKNQDSFLLENKDIALYFTSIRNIEFIPILSDRFQSKFDDIFNTTKITFDLEELKKKLEFISFYAKKKPSSLTYLNIDSDNKVILSVDDNNSVSVNVKGIEEKEKIEGTFSLPFNSTVMLEIIPKLAKGVDTIDLYASKDNNLKLFILSFGENERVILSKINV